MAQEKLRAKIYSKIGVLYFKVNEEEIRYEDIDRILEKWKHADLIEIFDKDNLVYIYTS
jgi:hypothetical protein